MNLINNMDMGFYHPREQGRNTYDGSVLVTNVCASPHENHRFSELPNVPFGPNGAIACPHLPGGEIVLGPSLSCSNVMFTH